MQNSQLPLGIAPVPEFVEWSFHTMVQVVETSSAEAAPDTLTEGVWKIKRAESQRISNKIIRSYPQADGCNLIWWDVISWIAVYGRV